MRHLSVLAVVALSIFVPGLGLPKTSEAQIGPEPVIVDGCSEEEGCFSTHHSKIDEAPPVLWAMATGPFGSASRAQITHQSNGATALSAATVGPGSAGWFLASGAGNPILVSQGSESRDLFVARTSQGKTRLRVLGNGEVQIPGDLHARGHLFLHAFEGDGKSGTAYVQARDGERTSLGLRLRTQQGGSVVEAVHITPDGRVGIGTQQPGQFALAVEGKIGAREIRVTVDQWADDALAAGYPLPPLEQVAEFIATNGHLPGVPREEVVLREGLALGELQAILLRKIEELTLHTIRQEEELQRQARLLDSLRAGGVSVAGAGGGSR